MEKIFAVIVTYNSDPEDLKAQYESLKNQVDTIIYVDNGSFNTLNIDDKSEKILLIKNEKNIGLAKGQNIGIHHALANGASHILLLDDDSIPQKDMVKHLIQNINDLSPSSAKVGLIGPLIYDEYSDELNNEGIIFSGIKIKKKLIEDKPLNVSYCIASGSLIPVNVLKDVGLMNEKLFIDALDVEWCLRAKSKGYNIYLSNNAKLNHKLGNGIDDRILSHSPSREYYIVRNNIYLARLSYIPLGYRLRKLALISLRTVKSFFKGNFNYFKSAIKGLKDGFFIPIN